MAIKAITSSRIAADKIIAPRDVANFLCSAKTANVIEIDVAAKTTPANKATRKSYPNKINASGITSTGTTTPNTAIAEDALICCFMTFKSDDKPE